MVRNTDTGYGLLAIALHWIVAFAFIANYALIYARELFLEPRSDLGRSFLSTHTAIGVSVLVFCRIADRLAALKPAAR